jgi:hypothetical protein
MKIKSNNSSTTAHQIKSGNNMTALNHSYFCFKDCSCYYSDETIPIICTYDQSTFLVCLDNCSGISATETAGKMIVAEPAELKSYDYLLDKGLYP